MPIAAVGNNFQSLAAVVTNDSQLAAVGGSRSQPIVLQAQNSQPSSFATTSTTLVGQSAFTSSVPVSSGQVVILQAQQQQQQPNQQRQQQSLLQVEAVTPPAPSITPQSTLSQSASQRQVPSKERITKVRTIVPKPPASSTSQATTSSTKLCKVRVSNELMNDLVVPITT